MTPQRGQSRKDFYNLTELKERGFIRAHKENRIYLGKINWNK